MRGANALNTHLGIPTAATGEGEYSRNPATTDICYEVCAFHGGRRSSSCMRGVTNLGGILLRTGRKRMNRPRESALMCSDEEIGSYIVSHAMAAY